MSINCPKCGYVRRLSDTVPEWQCPSCEVAYAKVKQNRLDTPEKENTPLKAPKSSAKSSTEKSKFEFEYNKDTVKLLVVGFVCLILGYFAGREHIKYELKSTFTNAVEGFGKNLSSVFSPPQKKEPKVIEKNDFSYLKPAVSNKRYEKYKALLI